MPDTPHSVVFCGTSAFAVPCLEVLGKDPRFKVELVVTQPDKPVGRKAILTPPSVKVVAEKLGLRIFQPGNINEELLSALHSQFSIFHFQFLVVVSYGQILSKEILALPKVAPVNVHASLLPRWRGASPIQHAILENDAESGVTVQIIEEKLDAGPVLSQSKTAVDPRETYTTLHDRLAVEGATLLIETLTKPLAPKPQTEAGITVCRKLSREDGRMNALDFTAEEIDRRVRALNPWPGVTLTIDESEMKILESGLVASSESSPLLCKNQTTLHLVQVQMPGGKPMSGAAWARGLRSK